MPPITEFTPDNDEADEQSEIVTPLIQSRSRQVRSSDQSIPATPNEFPNVLLTNRNNGESTVRQNNPSYSQFNNYEAYMAELAALNMLNGRNNNGFNNGLGFNNGFNNGLGYNNGFGLNNGLGFNNGFGFNNGLGGFGMLGLLNGRVSPLAVGLLGLGMLGGGRGIFGAFQRIGTFMVMMSLFRNGFGGGGGGLFNARQSQQLQNNGTPFWNLRPGFGRLG